MLLQEACVRCYSFKFVNIKPVLGMLPKVMKYYSKRLKKIKNYGKKLEMKFLAGALLPRAH